MGSWVWGFERRAGVRPKLQICRSLHGSHLTTSPDSDEHREGYKVWCAEIFAHSVCSDVRASIHSSIHSLTHSPTHLNPFCSSHLISSHLISSHLISFHSDRQADTLTCTRLLTGTREDMLRAPDVHGSDTHP